MPPEVYRDRTSRMDKRTVSLETPKQLAARSGLSERQIRSLIRCRQIEHVYVGARVMIPQGALESFIEGKKVRPSWHDKTQEPSSSSAAMAALGTSSGPTQM